MKVAFDHQIFSLQSHGGISRYFTHLARALTYQGVKARIFAAVHQNIHLQEGPDVVRTSLWESKRLGKATPLFEPFNRAMGKKWIGEFRPEVLHQTYYSPKIIKTASACQVITIHDMIPEKFPGKIQRNDPAIANKKNAILTADHIICVSRHTQNDLCEIYSIPEERTSVIHHGYEAFLTDARAPHTPARPFLLFVGNRSGYKNFWGLLQALAQNRQLRQELDVVAFGGGPFSSEETKQLNSLGLRAGSVRHASGGDAALSQHYAQASALVYPSLYEGFGIPPLEAMAHACPVVSSSTSSMPEVIGNAGAYFNPLDTHEMASAIETVVFNDTLKMQLIGLGLERVKLFTWEECALKTQRAYETALQLHRSGGEV